MDIHMLVASNLTRPRPAPPSAKAEDRYYREASGLPLPSARAAIATPAAILRRLLSLRLGRYDAARK